MRNIFEQVARFCDFLFLLLFFPPLFSSFSRHNLTQTLQTIQWKLFVSYSTLSPSSPRPFVGVWLLGSSLSLLLTSIRESLLSISPGLYMLTRGVQQLLEGRCRSTRLWNPRHAHPSGPFGRRSRSSTQEYDGTYCR